jgi:hypothetical protein
MNCRSQNTHDDFEEFILLLRAEDHAEVAHELHTLLHEVAWTTGSEMIGELGLEILKFQRSNPVMSPALQRLLRRCMAAVKQVWPHIEQVRRA